MTRKLDSRRAVAPGDILREWMDERHLHIRDAALKCGALSTRTFRGVLEGTDRLTPEVASHLVVGTGISARLWLNIERKYRRGLAEGKAVT